jgi:hypothetical protein
MILTVLEALVAPERADDLRAAFAAAGELPEGLLRSELLQSVTEPGRWRLQTLWSSREALERMRGQGTPAGVLMFRAAGVEPSLSIFNLEAHLPMSGGTASGSPDISRSIG